MITDASSWIAQKIAAFSAEVSATIESTELATELETVAGQVDKAATGSVNRLIRITVSDTVHQNTRATFRRRNLRLIKRLGKSEVETLRHILSDAEKGGLRVEEVSKTIRERLDVTKSHANLLARDQIGKLNGQITQARQTQAGIVQYRWSSSNDRRVRDGHAKLDGRVFAWDRPPVTNEDGDRNHPGEDYQCRCVAIPILPNLG